MKIISLAPEVLVAMPGVDIKKDDNVRVIFGQGSREGRPGGPR